MKLLNQEIQGLGIVFCGDWHPDFPGGHKAQGPSCLAVKAQTQVRSSSEVNDRRATIYQLMKMSSIKIESLCEPFHLRDLGDLGHPNIVKPGNPFKAADRGFIYRSPVSSMR